MWKNWENSQKIAFRIVLIYISLSILWVLFSDHLLEVNLIQVSDWVGTVKAWVFIIISGLLFYNLIQKEIKAIINAEIKYRLIVENVFDLIIVNDKDGNIEYASPSFN